ncbi:MAG: prolyl oligopeptidase family serine peptidase, partial [Amphiplicatus sp.]
MDDGLKSMAAAAAFLVSGAVLAADDPDLWLEEIEGGQALAWVRAETARSLGALEADPRFPALYEEARAILSSTARIPYGAIRNGAVYNFWRDETHQRGLWRRAGLENYRAGAPEWDILIDFDALAGKEGENWVHGGFVCLAPDYRHCMVEMSRGGKDASVWREFDTATKEFVAGGFALPEAKSEIAWLDADTLLVGTDLGKDSLTASGYPRKLVRLARGSALADAPVYFEAEASDVIASPRVEREKGVGHIFVARAVSFYETEYYYSRSDAEKNAKKKLPLPLNADLEGVLDGRAIFLLREDWTFGGAVYPQGAIIAYDLAKDAAELVMAAADNQSIGAVGVGETSLVVQYLEDVAGKAARLLREKDGAWKARPIGLPGNGVVSLVSAGGGTDDALVSFESLTTPDTLYSVTGVKTEKIASAPAFYDATGVVVEQRFATSADGTKIPYFIMGKDSVLKKGDAPVVQYGYGGFLSPTLPVYFSDEARPQHGAIAGKLWIARGGVLVLSNIRGGSEYGPRWHQAALKENRQRAFDDFIAISEDLMASGLTSPDKLGAVGRSNGGLLMGVMLTQRPDLYAAIDIGVPLFDM